MMDGEKHAPVLSQASVKEIVEAIGQLGGTKGRRRVIRAHLTAMALAHPLTHLGTKEASVAAAKSLANEVIQQVLRD